MQIHCIPRPGKQGRKRVVYETASKFAFHHINAWEADDDTIVIDTCAMDTIDFGQPLEQALEGTRIRSAAATPRRLVLHGNDRRAQEHIIRSDSYTEMPTPLLPRGNGRPHDHFFALVRSGSAPDPFNSSTHVLASVSIWPPLPNRKNGGQAAASRDEHRSISDGRTGLPVVCTEATYWPRRLSALIERPRVAAGCAVS